MRTYDEIKTALNYCAGNAGCGQCPFAEYRTESMAMCTSKMAEDALELVKRQNEVISGFLKVGYPHNFQREEPWIVDYMYVITDAMRQAVRLSNEGGVEA